MDFWPIFPWPRDPDYSEEFREIKKLLRRIMASQDDVNAAVAALQNEESGVAAVAADLQAAVTNIQQELAGLQGQGVDTSALNDAVAALQQPMSDLQAAQGSVDALETPAPPAV